MKVFIKQPDEELYEDEVENTLESLQEKVGGYIQTVTIANDCAIICDEEGRIKGLPENCRVCGVDFVGPILFVGVNGEEFCDMPIELELFKVMVKFWRDKNAVKK